ncbi:MAG: hypothetical protein CVT84_06310 [Alphaproteobacteria bacterium HGW-Alphaproteobacteria-6]|nr:MAG: hypothetical protein CVT84_06310 [Alphaproteobacteria bacterium HGW-Alphaproteobacteria-6]
MEQMITDTAAGAGTRGKAERSTTGMQEAGGLCPACGATVIAATVSTALWEGDALSVVRDVPALVCRGCHEHYFADDTVMRLDLMRAGDFASAPVVAQMIVPVFAFPATAEEQA